ncbi:MAG: M48 family metallopeptidase [Myxococcota bacterium]
MAEVDFDFQKYVERQRNPNLTREGAESDFGAYVYSGDVRALRQLRRLAPVRLVAETTVRLWNGLKRNELLGQSVRLSRRQNPEIYDITAQCARALDIAMPTVYVNNAVTVNAATYGTDSEAFIMLDSGLVDWLEPEELLFVIGHECGHLQNNHVVFNTALAFLNQALSGYAKWTVAPATLALLAWSRRAEITCDRAGLVCCMDERVALRAMLKVTVVSRKIFEQLDLDEYLEQLSDLQQGMGRFEELTNSHPYMPKRVKALQLFAQSAYYRGLHGEREGEALDQVDRDVIDLIKVL